MKNDGCPFEESVAEAARSGEWSPELESHRNGCLGCAELTLVVAALTSDAEELTAIQAPLPDPEAIWLRARLASRERDYHRATRAIVWVQRAAVAVVLAVGMAFAPGLWTMIRGGIQSLELSSAVVDLPRAAGSPLLVMVASLLVLGMLAIWELAVADESW